MSNVKEQNNQTNEQVAKNQESIKSDLKDNSLTQDNKKEQELNEKEKKLTEKEQTLNIKEQKLKKLDNDIKQEKNELERLKLGRENCFRQERNDFNREMLDKKDALEKELDKIRNEKLIEIGNEISEYRKKQFEQIQKYIEEEKKRVQKIVNMEKETWEKQKEEEKISTSKIVSDEKTAWEKQKEQERQELNEYKQEIINNINAEKQALEQQKNAWNTVKQDLTQKEQDLDNLKNELSQQKGALLALRGQYEQDKAMLEQAKLLNEQKISKGIEDGISGFRSDLESKIKRKDNQISDLLASNREIELTADCKKYYKFFKEQNLTPDNILSERTHLNEELRTANSKILDLEQKYKDYDIIKDEKTNLERIKKSLEAKLTKDADKLGSATIVEQQKNELDTKIKSLEKKLKIQEGEYSCLQSKYDELVRKYGTEEKQDPSLRIEIINTPIIKVTEIQTENNNIPEIDWLNGIYEKCKDIGFLFNDRLLKAFHTSLKVSDWAQLTVLAGVSGTGKSELPRLYSHFGGLYFMNVPVQPNWDSQESMLGFYNSIDNRFDAQDILRFLAQSQFDEKDLKEKGIEVKNIKEKVENSLKDKVCLILLDEMNLAHPELYFAEFLSKLEERRGKERKDVPKLKVNIGSDVDKYEIRLGRNVLWVGTMNQDETTKALSDKVVDRSMIINFPRPKDLVSRKLLALNDKNRGRILSYSTWSKYFVKRDLSFTAEEITPFNKFMTQINEYLGKIGRAIGHRVWQATEYYMANYPEVIASENDEVAKLNAMNIAFEDQLVQKVMPKLRGIDTSGESREVLDDIQRLLEKGIEYSNEFKEKISKKYNINFDAEIKTKFNLQADFEQALKLGYGYFVWQTAEYLK